MKFVTGHVSEIFGSFQGEGPRLGERHIFIRFCCCSLKCAYCDTKDAWARQPFAHLEAGAGKGSVSLPNPLPAEKVILSVLAQEVEPGFNEALSLTGGEPLEQADFLKAVLEGLAGRFKVLLETNGVLPEAFREVGPLVDIVSMDVKLPSVSGLGPLWEKHRAFLKVCGSKELIVKAVVSMSTPVEEVDTAARLVAGEAPGAVFVIQPLTPLERGGGPVAAERLFDFYDAAKRSLGKVRVIPQMHKYLGVR